MGRRGIAVRQAQVDVLSADVLLELDLVFWLGTIIRSLFLSDSDLLLVEYVFAFFFLLRLQRLNLLRR